MTSLWHHYDITMTSLCHHYDITMTSLWHHYDITMTSLWHHYDITMTSLWHHYDITMTSLWHHYDITMTSLWHHREPQIPTTINELKANVEMVSRNIDQLSCQNMIENILNRNGAHFEHVNWWCSVATCTWHSIGRLLVWNMHESFY